jgi:TRAP-type C4-dicarboxylate transport system permease small subunit
MNVLRKIDDILAKALRAMVVLFCVCIAVILFARVIIRFASIEVSLAMTDEIVEWLMAWMIFTAATVIMRDGGHFRVDLLDAKLKGKARHIVDALISLLGLGFIVMLFWYSFKLTAGTTQFSPIMKLPTSVFYACMPINCALMACYLVRDTAKSLIALAKANN